MKTAKFTRTIENFSCGHCGTTVDGNGYTNHCPACLWSRHVDVHPGDRLSECLALMEPIGLKQKGKILSIIHCCRGCGLIKPNKASPEDDRELLFKLRLTGRV